MAAPESEQRERDEAAQRILVVDDEATALRFAIRALKFAGFECDAATSVAEAQAALTRHEYDLLLTDLNLMDGTGTSLLRWVAARRTMLPVILITGYPTVASAIEAVRLDAVDYLVKPCDDLAGAVNAALARSKRRSIELHALRQWATSLRMLADRLDRHAGVTNDKGPKLEASTHPLWSKLSGREADVVGRLIEGDSVRMISQDLEISEHTVRNHLKAAYRKFGVRSQVELMRRLLAE